MSPNAPPARNGSHAPDDLNQHTRRIQELLGKIDTLADPDSREMVQECLESVLAFYGRGIERVLQVVEQAEAEGGKVYDALLGDATVRGLLLIHGLHPVTLETRLHQALDKVRPYMKSHGGDVELISLENDVARLRLQGHCETCPSSTVTLELAVRQAIEEACPDLQGFEVENAQAAAPVTHTPYATKMEWESVEGLHSLNGGGMLATHAGGVPIVLCKVEDDFYAYRDHCPACNMPLHLGALVQGEISCQLGHRYDARAAGRGLEGGPSHLDPIPLLVQDGVVKVAVGRETRMTPA